MSSDPLGIAQKLLDARQQQYTSSAIGVATQLGIMGAISLITIVSFSFFRPRQSKVYAPKIKYQLPPPANPLDDPDYEPPPPPLPRSFFAWLSPVVRIKEQEMITNIGLDATVFLRFVRMLLTIFCTISALGVVLIILYAIYNVKNVDAKDRRDILSMLSTVNVKGNYLWGTLAMSYLSNFIVMGLVWYNWQAVLQLRHRWFRSPSYQSKIYSRTLMITQVPREYRSDEGLIHLIGQLKVDGIKIQHEIDRAAIGRRLGDFPDLVEDHNQAVRDLEHALVKYLKHDKISTKRPMLRKGGFMSMGGSKVDAIDYLSKQIKFLRDKIDERRAVIDSLLRKERKARAKKSGNSVRVEGENYGFITLKTIAEAHRIARTHQGRLRELGGARIQLAPLPHDIVWKNISLEPSEIASKRTMGFLFIGAVCFLNTVPLTIVAALANLSSLTGLVPFIATWQNKSGWSLAAVSGVLPATLQALFGYVLPYIVRRITKYQGAQTRSRLERAVIARYFFFMVVSSLVVLVLLNMVFNFIIQIVGIADQGTFAVLRELEGLPGKIQAAYVSMSNYWLSWLPFRGFLIFFDLIQIIKLSLVSIRRFMFSYTPRDIRDLTKPPPFEYSIVVVNLLFIATVGLVYSALAPLVAIGAAFAFWFSLIVNKYQLLYVYITKAESGGRMWNVYVNRLLAALILMQLLMVLTMALVRERWWDAIAAAPPVFIVLIFKLYINKTIEYQFKHYRPTPSEAEAQQRAAMHEKHIKQSEFERRFINPSLLPDKLFKVMVHKNQEALARQVLASYPWLGVQIKAVREENLEYDPARDGPVDVRHEAEWDARSISSKLDMFDSSNPTPALSRQPSDMSFKPQFNPSTDYLLSNTEYYDGGPRYGRPSEEGQVPLLDPWEQQPVGGAGVPYPPSAYAYQRPPLQHNNTSSESIPLARMGPADHAAPAYAGGYATGPQHSRGTNSGGSATDMYGRPRQGSVGNVLDSYGRPVQRPRQGSAGSALDSFNRAIPQGAAAPIPRNTSAGSNLDLYGSAPMSRSGSGGSGMVLDQFGGAHPVGQPLPRSRSGSVGNTLEYGQQRRAPSPGNALDPYQRGRAPSPGNALQYGQPLQHARSNSPGNALDFGRQRSNSPGRTLDSYGQPQAPGPRPYGAAPPGGRY